MAVANIALFEYEQIEDQVPALSRRFGGIDVLAYKFEPHDVYEEDIDVFASQLLKHALSHPDVTIPILTQRWSREPFPSAHLCNWMIDDENRYREEVMKYSALAREAGESSARNALEIEHPERIDLTTARHSLSNTVRDLVHLFAATFPDVDVPRPVQLTSKGQFSLPVREFFRSRLIIDNESQFLRSLAEELWPLARAKSFRSGRGTLVVYAGELAIRVARQRPLGPKGTFEVPGDWEPARAPVRVATDRKTRPA